MEDGSIHDVALQHFMRALYLPQYPSPRERDVSLCLWQGCETGIPLNIVGLQSANAGGSNFRLCVNVNPDFTRVIQELDTCHQNSFRTLESSLSHSLLQWIPTLGHSGVLGLQFPEAFPTRCAGQGFWELQSKNACLTQGWEPLA